MHPIKSLLSIAAVTVLLAGSYYIQDDASSKKSTNQTVNQKTTNSDAAEEIEKLTAEIAKLRHQLAEAQMKASQASRELEELRQFISDNREYGNDFAQYKEIKKVTEQAERRKAAEEAKQRRLEQLKQRQEQRKQDATGKQQQRNEEERLEKYKRAGFQPLGLEVYMGRTGFFYGVNRQTGVRVEYEPIIGDFLEPISRSYIDFSEMTISGTILNASEETRNIGVAVAFFDRRGNQVGSETIQIQNARSNVPYPFSSTLTMGLDQAFSTSSSWVLYSDPVESNGN